MTLEWSLVLSKRAVMDVVYVIPWYEKRSLTMTRRALYLISTSSMALHLGTRLLSSPERVALMTGHCGEWTLLRGEVSKFDVK